LTAVALTIAGSDPSGGAGIQADLKTFHRFQAYGMSAITLLTVQNTQGVEAVQQLTPQFIEAQLLACVRDIPPGATKTGALGSVDAINVVARHRQSLGVLVCDPVMISKHNAPLLAEEAVAAFHSTLLPLCDVITPNLPEASRLLGRAVHTREDMEAAARALVALGAKAALVKGGHRSAGEDASDVLFDGSRVHWYSGERVNTVHTHGTGCTYSAAMTALLARGKALSEAAHEAKAFIARAIATAPQLGHGQGPVNHFA
jgi:hydroxymethylpyrimidine/phosphomethylpyrimidine kinase